MSTKSCSACRVEKPVTEFGARAANRDGLQSECRPCANARAALFRAKNPESARAASRAYCERNRAALSEKTKAWKRANPERARDNFLRATRVSGWARFAATKAKLAARRRGWSFDLDADFVLALFEKQQGRCHWLGIELQNTVEHRGPERPSLDRLDISRGYTRDNVVLACQFANLGRSTLTAERFEAFIVANRLRAKAMPPGK